MMRWTWRVRCGLLTLSAGGLWAFNGCGLSDQQWATIWQSVLTTALNTIVSGTLSQAG